ncbi:Peptidase of plants and bacteria domain containing protein [Rhypophila sp. PSN 637]
MTVTSKTSNTTEPESLTTAMSSTFISPPPATTILPQGFEAHDQGDLEFSPQNNDGPQDDDFNQPKLRLEIRDLQHPGALKFLASVNAASLMSAAVRNVQRHLYRSPADVSTNPPGTRSVTVVLRDMDGVAFTTGKELDDDHKEIHLSLRYIHSVSPHSRLSDEITGVLTHELVHCYQWNARGTCPSGLIEGIADWVRLRCGLSPPHWKRETDGTWDKGYEHTAYFLDFLEQRFGPGTVRRINEKLRRNRYMGEEFWTGLLGFSIEKLWKDYVMKTA